MYRSIVLPVVISATQYREGASGGTRHACQARPGKKFTQGITACIARATPARYHPPPGSLRKTTDFGQQGQGRALRGRVRDVRRGAHQRRKIDGVASGWCTFTVLEIGTAYAGDQGEDDARGRPEKKVAETGL